MNKKKSAQQQLPFSKIILKYQYTTDQQFTISK